MRKTLLGIFLYLFVCSYQIHTFAFQTGTLTIQDAPNFRNYEGANVNGHKVTYTKYAQFGVSFFAPSFSGISLMSGSLIKFSPENPMRNTPYFIALYDIPPIRKNIMKNIQTQIIETGVEVYASGIYADREDDKNITWENIKGKGICKLERYNNNPITSKKGYLFFRIKESPMHFALQCGDTSYGHSMPQQYYIYSRKTGRVLYVNLTQDPYIFDPTTIEF